MVSISQRFTNFSVEAIVGGVTALGSTIAQAVGVGQQTKAQRDIAAEQGRTQRNLAALQRDSLLGSTAGAILARSAEEAKAKQSRNTLLLVLLVAGIGIYFYMQNKKGNGTTT